MCTTGNLKWSVLLTIFLLLMKNAGNTSAKVVSRPSQRYVLDGHQGLVWCQNRSSDEQSFHSYVDDAIWYRWINDSISQMVSTTSGFGVYSSTHTLIFYPTVRESDQGYYYCCSSAGDLCSDRTDVRISVPPTVTAVIARFVKAVGSATVTLQCNISNRGIPQANIGWKKDGVNVNNAHILTNDTFTSMTLSALTEEDSGLYTCIAIGAYSDHSDSIELIVESPPYITAIKSNYTTVFGSKVTLVCMIVQPGEPRAAFRWTKNGENIDSTYPVTINDSFISITITNVTTQDTGTYTCTATGIESYHSDSIQLRIVSKSKENYTNSSKSQPITVTAEGLSLNCDENTGSVFKNLSNYIQLSYGYTVTITASAMECVNKFKTIYKIEIISTSAASLNEILPLLLNALSTEGLHLGEITIKLCSMECTEMQSTVLSNEEGSKIHPSHLAALILMILIIITATILLLLVTCIWYKRKRYKTTNFHLKRSPTSTSSNVTCLNNGQNKTTTPEYYTEVYSDSKNKLSIMQDSQI